MTRSRPGYTIVEVCIAFAFLTLVLSLVAQLGYWSLRQRLNTEARQTALELATNILEEARGMPAEKLSVEWAASQKLPAELEPLLPGGKLKVDVEPEAVGTRRVSVEIVWHPDETNQPRQVKLTTLLGPRFRDAKGGTP